MLKSLFICFIFISSLAQTMATTASSDTLRLYYNIDVSILNDNQFKQLDTLLKATKSQEIFSIEINAYADFLATTEYNMLLSQRRADNVKQYFTSKGYANNIKNCIGKGELLPELHQSQGIPENRRVDIIFLYKPKVVESAKSKSIELKQAKEGDHIILTNFNFLPGRHYLTPASQPELEVLLNSLAENPTLHIEIQGHICCEYIGKDGFDADNLTNNLSVNRAKYIYDYLIKNGIDSERLQYKGLGSSKPLVYPENTAVDQNKNRRVEIVIIKK